MTYRVLIIQTAYLGDVVLSLPLVDELRRNLTEFELDYLAIPSVMNVLENYPGISRVIPYDKRDTERGFQAFVQKVRFLKDQQYDLALLPHRSWRSASLAKWAAIPVRIGFNRSWASFLYTHVIPYDETVHEVNRNLSLLQPLGVLPKKKTGLQLAIAPEDIERVDAIWQESRLEQGRPCVALAPGSVWATKRWLPDRFAQLIRELTAEGIQVVLIGGPADAPLGRELEKSASKNIANFIGKLTPRESAEAIRRCAVLVSNDSAPVHLASAVGTKVVEIFGPTIPEFGFTPFGVSHRILEKKLDCRPCGDHGGNKCPLNTFACMKSISVAEVYHAVKELLDET
ncbi:MAG: lipopolysaccharide heptosyltransferase II [Calditrichaeota bacterium]|nr:lipopolysaccharide heptosyltransferase II [Calditrichota bacterium]